MSNSVRNLSCGNHSRGESGLNAGATGPVSANGQVVRKVREGIFRGKSRGLRGEGAGNLEGVDMAERASGVWKNGCGFAGGLGHQTVGGEAGGVENRCGHKVPAGWSEPGCDIRDLHEVAHATVGAFQQDEAGVFVKRGLGFEINNGDTARRRGGQGGRGACRASVCRGRGRCVRREWSRRSPE